MSETLSTRNIDKRRWSVLVLQMLVGSVTAYVYNLTIYIGPFQEQLGWDPTVVILVWTVMMGVAFPGSLIGGKINDKYGSKAALKIGGLAFGIAVVASSFSTSAMMFVVIDSIACMCMYIIYTSQLANVAALFPDRSSFAMGIFIGATSLGTAVMVPFTEWLTRSMDLMHGIALQGVIYGLITVICGFLIVEAPEGYMPAGMAESMSKEEQVNIEDGKPNYTVAEILKKPAFWILLLGVIFGSAFFNGMSANLSLVVQASLSVSTVIGAWMYSAWQLGSAAGGAILGFASDKWFGPVKTFMLLCAVCAALCYALVAVGVSTQILFIIVIVMLGFGCGSVLTLIPSTALQVFGQRNFGFTYGVMCLSGTVAATIGTQITTRVAPNMIFILGGTLLIIGAVFFLLMLLVMKKAKKEAN